MYYPPEFKKSLSLLPDKEKDKLILRLLKHDLQLANRLLFELVSTDTVEDKRGQVRTEIIKRIQWATERYYSAGILLMDVREVSGMINEHVSITKDKQGEIFLNCLMLRRVLEMNNNKVASETWGNAYTFCIYIIARVFKILMLMQKQHEDLHIEFQEDIEEIGKLIGRNPHLMKAAIQNGLDVNWLIGFDIPKDIAAIYKDLRDREFLR
jgi:hypothetical protein